MNIATIPGPVDRAPSQDLGLADSQSLRNDYRRCLRCMMDTSDPEIAFDESGDCRHCHHFDHRMQSEHFVGDDQSLQQLVEQIRSAGRGKDYDCVIGVSGGMDSTYVAYTVRKLGLRPLAVHLDN